MLAIINVAMGVSNYGQGVERNIYKFLSLNRGIIIL